MIKSLFSLWEIKWPLRSPTLQDKEDIGKRGNGDKICRKWGYIAQLCVPYLTVAVDIVRYDRYSSEEHATHAISH